MARQDSKSKTNKYAVNVAMMIKFYSAFILLLDIMFIFTIGELEKPDQSDSLDQMFKKNYPVIYKNLWAIGFRVYVEPG
jgi:hypothetical protein